TLSPGVASPGGARPLTRASRGARMRIIPDSTPVRFRRNYSCVRTVAPRPAPAQCLCWFAWFDAGFSLCATLRIRGAAMTDLYPPRDWLESVPELEVPTDEEVQLEMNVMCRSDSTTRRFGAVENDWADRYED